LNELLESRERDREGLEISQTEITAWFEPANRKKELSLLPTSLYE